MTQIYLAGKIAHSDWRHDVSGELRGASTERSYLNNVGALPEQIGTRYHDVTYVGPFFAGCDHGCAHGGDTHARSGGCTNGHSRPRTAADCLAQIDRADVVFAWLDELEPSDHCTAYGTLVEVGYALARGKHIVVGASQAPQEPGESGIINRKPIDDVWFAWTVASQRVVAPSPLAALDEITAAGRAWR